MSWLRRLPCCLAFFSLLLTTPATSHGEEVGAEKVPLERIVLFNSGVGFFEHQGEVEDNDLST